MSGEFGLDAAGHVSLSVIASVSGLWAIMLVRVLAPGFNARQDTATPVRYGIISMVTNIICSLIIVFPIEYWLLVGGNSGYGYLGLALSTTLSSIVNASLLLRGLAKKNIYHISRNTVVFVLKLLAGTIVMSMVLMFLKGCFAADAAEWAGISHISSIVYLVCLVASGAAVYFVTLLLLGIRPSQLKGA